MRNHAAAAHHVQLRRHHRHHATHAVHHRVNRFLGLPLGVIIALAWANTVPEPYFRFAQSLAFGVNEIGMALFVGLIMQEVVEATMEGGALHSWRRWTLPLIAAAGGIAGSAGAYLAYVTGRYELILTAGWPIACAIDIAAAYYVLKSILPRSGMLPFVLLLAIVTDLFGMLVVAATHPRPAAGGGGLTLLLVALGLAGGMRMLKVRAFWPYLAICGALSWLAFYREGLHPAFALVPIVPFLPHEPRKLDLLADPPDDDAVHHFEHEWNTLVQVVLFLFGLVNGGVILKGYDTGTWASHAGGACRASVRHPRGGRPGRDCRMASAAANRLAAARGRGVCGVERLYLRALLRQRHPVNGSAAGATDHWRARDGGRAAAGNRDRPDAARRPIFAGIVRRALGGIPSQERGAGRGGSPAHRPAAARSRHFRAAHRRGSDKVTKRSTTRGGESRRYGPSSGSSGRSSTRPTERWMTTCAPSAGCSRRSRTAAASSKRSTSSRTATGKRSRRGR